MMAQEMVGGGGDVRIGQVDLEGEGKKKKVKLILDITIDNEGNMKIMGLNIEPEAVKARQ